jgi:hypothetical protein
MYDFLACVGVIARWAHGNLRNLLRSDTPPHEPHFRQSASDTSTDASNRPGTHRTARLVLHPAVLHREEEQANGLQGRTVSLHRRHGRTKHLIGAVPGHGCPDAGQSNAELR